MYKLPFHLFEISFHITVGCAEPKCKKSYHLNCGNTHKALFQFYDQFKSYCREHRHSNTILSTGGFGIIPVFQASAEDAAKGWQG